jgi:hypothetical protein
VPLGSRAVGRGAQSGFVPIVARPLGADVQPPMALRDLNYIHFYAEPSFPGSGWGSGLSRLHAALCVDISWIREHTESPRWRRAGRPSPAPSTSSRAVPS